MVGAATRWKGARQLAQIGKPQLFLYFLYYLDMDELEREVEVRERDKGWREASGGAQRVDGLVLTSKALSSTRGGGSRWRKAADGWWFRAEPPKLP